MKRFHFELLFFFFNSTARTLDSKIKYSVSYNIYICTYVPVLYCVLFYWYVLCGREAKFYVAHRQYRFCILHHHDRCYINDCTISDRSKPLSAKQTDCCCFSVLYIVGIRYRVQELCGSRGGRPVLPVPNRVRVRTVSVVVKQH